MASLATDENPTDDFDPEEFDMSNVSNTISMGDNVKITSNWKGLKQYHNKIGIIIGRKDYGRMTLRDARQYVIRMDHYGNIIVVGSDAFEKTIKHGVNEYPETEDRVIITSKTPDLSRYDTDRYYLKTGQVVAIRTNTMELSYVIKMDVDYDLSPASAPPNKEYTLNDFIVYDFDRPPYEPENINKFVFVHGGGSRPENTMYPGYVGKIVGESTDQGGVPVKIINTRKLEMVSEGNVVYNLRDIRVIRTEVLAGPEYVWHAIRGDKETNDIPNVEEYNLQPQIHVNQRVRVTSNFGNLSKYKEPKTGTVIEIIDTNNISPGVSIVYEIKMDEDGIIFALGRDAFEIIEHVPYTEPSARGPRLPRENDSIIVIQSPLRYQYYTGILEELKGSPLPAVFDAKLSEVNGKIVSLDPQQFLVITSWFPKKNQYVVAPKYRGGIIGKVIKTDMDERGLSFIEILPKYDIRNDRPIKVNYNRRGGLVRLSSNYYLIDDKVKIYNEKIRRGVLEDKWVIEDNNLVNNMLELAKGINTNNDKKKPAEKSKRSPGGSEMEELVKHYQEERERLSEKFKRERNDFKDKIKELEHYLEIGDQARYNQIVENEKLEAKIKSAEAKEQDLDTFHCAICFDWICPISKHLFSTDELENEFTEEELNETVENDVLECDNCHKRFHSACLNSWLNTANSHGRCPFCREIINAVIPVKQLKMTWFANRLHLKF